MECLKFSRITIQPRSHRGPLHFGMAMHMLLKAALQHFQQRGIVGG